MASQLLTQLAERSKAFLRHSGLTQSRLCRHLSISDSPLSQFLQGTKGLDPTVLIKLCQTLSLSHREIQTKFVEPVRSTKILNLQQSVAGLPARPMRLDANEGWYPGTDGSGVGQDPNDGRTIDDAPDAVTTGPTFWDQALIDTLRETRGFHKKAVRVINNFINKAKANAGILCHPLSLKNSGAEL
jgi:transcriptional regulator with XRE-family HTH domain